MTLATSGIGGAWTQPGRGAVRAATVRQDHPGAAAAQPATRVNYFDLEDPASLARLDEPMTALRPLEGLVVIDEVQRRPDLFPVLRVLADRTPNPARFLILGSASGDLLRQTSESLAGRIERVVIGGFSLHEVGAARCGDLWLPRRLSALVPRAERGDSVVVAQQFIQTLLERDLPQWGVRVPADGPAPLLDRRRALPRPDLERRRCRAHARA